VQAGGSVDSQASDSEKFGCSFKPDNAQTRCGLTSTLCSRDISMRPEVKKISLSRQLVTCAAMCGLAVTLIFLFHRQTYVSQILVGLPIPYQALLGAMLGVLYWAASVIGYKYTAGHQATQSTVESYSRLDLHGWNPLWIALAAGFGEELLFRGALQPLIGIWFTSVLFVLVHTRAYRFNNFSNRVFVQALGIFAVSVVLGFIAKYAGLITAIIVHTAMDVCGLYIIRRVAHVQAAAAA
jgi:membrane protease YdiL (CAAX protease family)